LFHGTIPGETLQLIEPQQSRKFKGVSVEIVFEVVQEEDGGFCAECLTESIFTQGDTWEELRSNVKEAVEAYYFDQPRPSGVRLHLVRDEVFALG
jgi:predicted RNase H-like HicB family nuclease